MVSAGSLVSGGSYRLGRWLCPFSCIWDKLGSDGLGRAGLGSLLSFQVSLILQQLTQVFSLGDWPGFQNQEQTRSAPPEPELGIGTASCLPYPVASHKARPAQIPGVEKQTPSLDGKYLETSMQRVQTQRGAEF